MTHGTKKTRAASTTATTSSVRERTMWVQPRVAAVDSRRVVDFVTWARSVATAPASPIPMRGRSETSGTEAIARNAPTIGRSSVCASSQKRSSSGIFVITNSARKRTSAKLKTVWLPRIAAAVPGNSCGRSR